jgi:hypothetical protein
MKPIESVDKNDLVWDGIEWVHHEGVIYQGYYEVITHDGLTATPDHKCWTETGEGISIGEIASSMGRYRLAMGESTGNPVRYYHTTQTNNPKGYDGLSNTKIHPPKRAHVYDLLNAGPRHRFTVSGKIVFNCNFGLIYGMRPDGFREYARTGFDLILTAAEAEEWGDKFFATYDRLHPWHNNAINYAKKHKQVISPLGRIRHLPLIDSPVWFVKSRAERMAINAPVQSTLSDVCLYGIGKIRERFTEQEVWISGMTHDSLGGYIPTEHAISRLTEMKHIMENLPLKEEFQWEPKVPFVLDVETSITNLSELKGIQL